MGNKLKAIFTLGIAVVIVGVLHMYIFAPKKAQWDEYVADCDAAESVWQEQQKERLHFSFN